MDEWEGLTDEEIARKLQEQFEREEAELNAHQNGDVVAPILTGNNEHTYVPIEMVVGGDGDGVEKSSKKRILKDDIIDTEEEEVGEDEDAKLARLLQQEYDNERENGAKDEELARALQNEFQASQQFLSGSFLSSSTQPWNPVLDNVEKDEKEGEKEEKEEEGEEDEGEEDEGEVLSLFPTLSPSSVPVPPPPSIFSFPSAVKEPKKASRGAITRLIKDIQGVKNSKNGTIFIHSDENDITQLEALIIGPEDTPYAGGMYHFKMDFPEDYPWHPPKVELITTDYGKCRFNPNLYACGKVCLSILGTWSGPAWTPVQTCLSTLQSIQTLMNSAPYHNEPGYEVDSDCIRHETIRVAVCGMMEIPTCGTEIFRKELRDNFRKWYPKYQETCKNYMDKDGTPMKDPFGEERGAFQYGQLLARLVKIQESLGNEEDGGNEEEEKSS